MLVTLVGLALPPMVGFFLFTIGLKLDFKSLANNEIWGVSLAHIVTSTLFYAGVLWLGKVLIPSTIFDVSPFVIVLVAFALSFSCTVYAVKVLEDRDDMRAFYGKVASDVALMTS